MSKEDKKQPTDASIQDSDNKQTRYCDVMSNQPTRTRHAVLLGIVRGVMMLKVKRGQTESFWQNVKDHAQKLKLTLPQTSSKLSFIKNMYWLDEEKECQKLNKKLFCAILMAAGVDQQEAAAEWDAAFSGTSLPEEEEMQQALPIPETNSDGGSTEQQDQSMEDLKQQVGEIRRHQAGLENFMHDLIKEIKRVLPTAGILEVGDGPSNT